MVIYIVVVFGMVAVTSAVLMYIFRKMQMLNYPMILAVSLSSILAGLLFPGIFLVVSKDKGIMADAAQLTFALVATLMIFIVLVLILSTVISVVIPGGAFAVSAFGNKKAEGEDGYETFAIEKIEPAAKEAPSQEVNYLEEIYGKLVVETANKSANVDEYTQPVENNLEKSVDSAENIDKMRLETLQQDDLTPDGNLPQNEENSTIDTTEGQNAAVQAADAAGELSLEDCVDEAFRLKGQGDCEGAILYFMYALDRKPDSELAFWIVLDICVLYRSIGQVDFAKDMLSTYFNTYNGFMDDQVRNEIEGNLLSMDRYRFCIPAFESKGVN